MQFSIRQNLKKNIWFVSLIHFCHGILIHIQLSRNRSVGRDCLQVNQGNLVATAIAVPT